MVCKCITVVHVIWCTNGEAVFVSVFLLEDLRGVVDSDLPNVQHEALFLDFPINWIKDVWELWHLLSFEFFN